MLRLSAFHIAAFLGFTCLSLISLGEQTYASTFVVKSTADTPGDACGADCTLRQAVTAANASHGEDAIIFDLNSFATKQTIDISDELPAITDDLSITGPSTPGAGLTIRGFPRKVAFRSHTQRFTLSNISVTGTLYGIIIVKGITTITGCTFYGNGLAIMNASLQTPFIDGREVSYPKHLMGVVLEFSTLIANNCTIANNSTGIVQSTGPVLLDSCTIAGNDVGICANDNVFKLSNCLIAGNSYLNVGFTSYTTCIFIKDQHSITTGTASQWGLDPEGLQDNGGLTPTIALTPKSSAVDTGETNLLTDQRGLERPQKRNCDVGAFQTQQSASSIAALASKL